VVLVDDRVDQEPAGVWQHEGGDAVDHHQHEAERQQPTPGTHQLPDFRQDGPESLDLGGLRQLFGIRTQLVIGLRQTCIGFIITAL